jgi:hypothetical protein
LLVSRGLEVLLNTSLAAVVQILFWSAYLDNQTSGMKAVAYYYVGRQGSRANWRHVLDLNYPTQYAIPPVMVSGKAVELGVYVALMKSTC